MGVVKSTYEFQLNLSQAIQMFLHRDQFHCVQIHTYAEAENTLPKRFNKQLPILKVKKVGFHKGCSTDPHYPCISISALEADTGIT